MSKGKAIPIADALKFFSSVKVRTAEAALIEGADGKKRPGFKTAQVALGEEHVTGAADYGDRVVITTIDGQKHEAGKKAKKAA